MTFVLIVFISFTESNEFKVIYDQKMVKIISAERSELTFELSHKNSFTGHSRLMLKTDDYRNVRTYMEIRANNDRFPNGKFVVEGEEGVDCNESDLPDLSPWDCKGGVTLRRYYQHLDG